MKTIARVKFCEEFIKALKNTKDFSDLHTYCRHWANNIEADDTILCEVIDDVDTKTGQPKKSLKPEFDKILKAVEDVDFYKLNY